MRNCESVERVLLAANKRVNYTFGMILGEAEFRQEQEHFEWKQRLNNALLHGYGTVCGLRVTCEPTEDATDVKVRISSGYGISPRGNWIWVPGDQCARLNEWVQRHRDDAGAFAAPGPHRAHVNLCYDECAVDPVPIAGRPCATEEDTRAPSRIQEAFQATFSWQPPHQIAADVYRQLGQVLDQVVIVDDGSPPTDDRAMLLEFVRDLGLPSSPPASPPLASPPGKIQLHRSTAADTFQQVLILWTTIVCPRLLPTTLEAGQDEDCILLAHLDFAVDSQGNVVVNSVTVDESNRPVLVSDQLQQELMTRL